MPWLSQVMPRAGLVMYAPLTSALLIRLRNRPPPARVHPGQQPRCAVRQAAGTHGNRNGYPCKNPLEGDFSVNQIAGNPAGLIDPITGTLGTLEYDHGAGISITGGFVYRGSAIAQLYGKCVFGDLALRNAPPRVDGRQFYADQQTGEIHPLLLPQFSNNGLPNGLTLHGFGDAAAGELYALVTNTASGGTGGIVYRIAAGPGAGPRRLAGPGCIGVGLAPAAQRGSARQTAPPWLSRWRRPPGCQAAGAGHAAANRQVLGRCGAHLPGG